MTDRQKRRNGIESSEAILDAAARIAGERGYEGTSISAVSTASGAPASSIYWHFENKDELIAAVIERSFEAWVDALDRGVADATDDPHDVMVTSFRDSARQLQRFPDFLRLGLMLVLEQRPDELAARRRFREVRAITLDRLARRFGALFDGIDVAEQRRLARFTLATSDGLFIAADVEGIDLVEAFEDMADAIHGLAVAGGWAPPVTSRSVAESADRR